ncbi:MAG: hypothetical protein JOZ10_19245 [Acidobacteria bacterium]|nr:hypothetical protein [Acidobacteriota bacterium]MBV9145750.1 hypothetical protein [Acidobacteriota bacterium]MBV9436998.1 hypothetical protein [Acidobacteriota bacterium]
MKQTAVKSFVLCTRLRVPQRIPRLSIALYFLLLGISASSAQVAPQQPATSDSDKRTIEMLLERIEKLEARVAQLEHSSGQPSPPHPGSAAAPEPASSPSAMETVMSERMDFSRTLLKIRGFGDINLRGSNQKGDTTSFNLGQLNLFVTSDVSDRFKFLGEIVFEAGPDNIYGVTRPNNNFLGVDVERLLLQYSHNDYFNLALGRYHTAIGYYNTAYHHSTWFQTTEDRPLVFQFEDRGGILPIHNVGASASGRIPSGSLGLHYVAEIGNGRESRAPIAEEPVQNTIDENNHKAFNFAFFSTPAAVPGLQAGFSVYHDRLTPANVTPVAETILAAHAVLIRPRFEWLNEALLVRHTEIANGALFQTPAFYSQVSHQFGSYRPYFRYQYLNASGREPIFPDIGLRQGPSVGIRYDASEFVAVKLQYDYTKLRSHPDTQALGMQVGFTF